MKEKISRIINSANNLSGREKIISEIYFSTSIFLIALTPVLLYIEFVKPVFFQNYFDLINYIDSSILIFFTIDLFLRIFVAKNKFKYIFGLDGIVDTFAVLPELILLMIGFGGSSTWLRVIKLFRYIKSINNIKGKGILSGFTRTMLLTSTGVVSVKILILIMESRNFIPEFENISIVLGLVSFSLAMLLGTKLGIVNKRLFDLEDSITRIVAGIKVFWFTNKDIRPHLLKWLDCFYNHIKNPTPDSASRMREENNWLYEKIGKVGINPNFVGLSRDAAFVLNKSVSEVNPFYERFLFIITMVFTMVVLVTIPGITGLVASFIISFIFFGLYFLVEDMDKPLDFGDDSLIYVDLSSLEDLIDDLKE